MAPGLGRGKKWVLGCVLVTGTLVALGSTMRQAETQAHAPRGAGGHAALAASGPQRWVLGDRTIDVTSTYYVVMPRPDGTPAAMFVAEVVGLDPSLTMENVSERGDALALPLMQHAVRERLHERVRIGTADGHTVLDVEWIGIVVLVSAGLVSNSGYRTRLSLAEIEATMSPPLGP